MAANEKTETLKNLISGGYICAGLSTRREVNRRFPENRPTAHYILIIL